MANNYFWAEDEVRIIQDPQTKLFEDQEAYRSAMTNFLLSGLKSLGYTKAYTQLERESGVKLPRVLDDDLRQNIQAKDFDRAIAEVSDAKSIYSGESRNLLLYELLKLKFTQAMAKGDTVTALCLLRNDLKDYAAFNTEKKQLSGLYLLSTPEEIYEAAGIDLASSDFAESFLARLEMKLLNAQSNQSIQEPFDYMCRNSLSYELITCRYHKPGTSEAIAQQCTGIKHTCSLDYYPSNVHQVLEESIDELWDVKLSSDAMNIYALTRDRIFMCWTFNVASGLYEHKWTSQNALKEEINDWCLNEHDGCIVAGTTENSIKIIDSLSGDFRTTVQAAHDDSVNKVAVRGRGDELISVSVDCNIKIWDSKNLSRKEFVKTKRALSMVMGIDEDTLYIIYANYKVIDRVNLSDKSISERVIVEKDCIVSSSLSPDGKFLLLNTGRVSPELHLYRLEDYRLLNSYTGHSQAKFCIGVGFLSNNVFFSGSETGELILWHVNQSEPIVRLRLHTLSLNSVASGFNKALGRQVIVTASDDYKIKVLL